MMFSAYKVWILLATSLLAATVGLKYLLKGKVTFGPAATVNVCKALYAFVSGHWDEAQGVSPGALSSQEKAVVTSSMEWTSWCKYAGDYKPERKSQLMTSVLKDKKLAVKTPKYHPPQACHCASGCNMLPLTCTAFPVQFSDTWKQGLLQDLNSFLPTLLKNTKHQVTPVNSKWTAFQCRSISTCTYFITLG